ncbi:unnamed protein product [Colias eurytheme]|nr:unnamed protein product [Colias eurytheme]
MPHVDALSRHSLPEVLYVCENNDGLIARLRSTQDNGSGKKLHNNRCSSRRGQLRAIVDTGWPNVEWSFLDLSFSILLFYCTFVLSNECFFIKTARGHTMLLAKGYNYTQKSGNGARRSWQCTKRSYRGYAPIFQHTAKGHLVLINRGQKFTLNNKLNEKRTWRCSKHKSRNCKARAITIGNEIVLEENEHSHPNAPIFQHTAKGHLVLINRGQKFTLSTKLNEKRTWRCSKQRSRNCKARVITLGNEIVLEANEHSHP